MTTDKNYNGWTNYATWRVNLEIFDGMSPADIAGDDDYSAYQMAGIMKEYAEEMLSGDSLAVSYALAFMADVNWYEIAQHKIEEYEDA